MLKCQIPSQFTPKYFLELLKDGRSGEARTLLSQYSFNVKSTIDYSDPEYGARAIFIVLECYIRFLDSNILKIAENLFKGGANPNTITSSGLSCFDLALKNPAVMRLVLKYKEVTLEHADPKAWTQAKENLDGAVFVSCYTQLLYALQKNEIIIPQNYIDFLEDIIDLGEIDAQDIESLKQTAPAPDTLPKLRLTSAHCEPILIYSSKVNALAQYAEMYYYSKKDYVESIKFPPVPFLGLADDGE